MVCLAESVALETARHGEQIATLFNGLSDLKADVKEVRAIASNVQELALSVKTMATTMEKMEKKVDSITSAPAEKWNKLVWLSITAIVSTVLGAVLTSLIKGG